MSKAQKEKNETQEEIGKFGLTSPSAVKPTAEAQSVNDDKKKNR